MRKKLVYRVKDFIEEVKGTTVVERVVLVSIERIRVVSEFASSD